MYIIDWRVNGLVIFPYFATLKKLANIHISVRSNFCSLLMDYYLLFLDSND